MDIPKQEFAEAEARMARLREAAHAVSARYDRRRDRIVVAHSTGLELAFPPSLADGLHGTAPTPSPTSRSSRPAPPYSCRSSMPTSLCRPCCRVCSVRAGMAAQLGAAGGRARSPAKASSARENGRKGGRPRKQGVG